MLKVQAYLYTGLKSQSETGIDYETRRKLETYSSLLKDYARYIIKEDNVMSVERISFEKDVNVNPGYFIGSIMKVNKYDPEYLKHAYPEIKDKDDYRDYSFNTEKHNLIPEQVTTQVTYATGVKAAVNIRNSELENLKQERANYQESFIVTEVFKKIVSGVAKKADVSDFVEVGSLIMGNVSGAKELDNQIITRTALLGAEALNLEVSILEEGRYGKLTYQLYPLDSTYEKFHRWREVHEEYPEIPFPKEAINMENWYEVSNIISQMQTEFSTEITNYILEGEGKFDGKINK